MAVLVEESELVGKEALVGRGEYGSFLTYAGGLLFSCPS